MNLVFTKASREDTVLAYEALKSEEFTGRHDFDEIFDMIKDMEFDNIGSEKYSLVLGQ